MVIISAVICTKQGQIILARNFQPIEQLTLEEHVKNFPKSISKTQQHTFVETNKIRYVYLPMDKLYLMLITNKSSNIIEDLQALRQLRRIVQEICVEGVRAETVKEAAFDLLLCFDDAISLGYRECVSLTQINNSLQMESSEEKLHKMIMQERMNEAKEKISQFAKQQDLKRKGLVQEIEEEEKIKKTNFGKEEITHHRSDLPVFEKDEQEDLSKQKQSGGPKSGMQLFKKKQQKQKNRQKKLKRKKEDMSDTIMKEEGHQKEPKIDPLAAPVRILLQEKITAKLSKEGQLKSFNIIGQGFVQVLDPEAVDCSVFVNIEKMKGLKQKTHPMLDRNVWKKQQVFKIKNNKTFPARKKVPTVKYNYSSSNADDIPFTFEYWANNQTLTFEVEFNTDHNRFTNIENLDFLIEIPSGERPVVNNLANSSYLIQQNELKWSINKLNEEDSGASVDITFSEDCDIDEVFPVLVQLDSKNTFFKFDVKKVIKNDTQKELKFDFQKSSQFENFVIGFE